MITLSKYVLAFVLAVLVTAVLGSVFSTQFVLAALQDIGVDTPFPTRLWMTAQDFGILTAMAALVAACFLVGFLVAGFASSKIGGSRKLWFVTAGLSAFIIELLIIRSTLGLMPLSGARTTAGLLAQGISGGAGTASWAGTSSTGCIRCRWPS